MALLFSACSTANRDAPAGAAIGVTVKDFRISAPREVRAGTVRLSVRNKGPDDHEFIVVRVAKPRLPLRPDGLTVDEDAVENETVVVVEPTPPGSTTGLRIRLRPGRYELLCNMSGHYLGGMHARLRVR